MTKVKTKRHESTWGISWELKYGDRCYHLGFSWQEMSYVPHLVSHVRSLLQLAKAHLKSTNKDNK